MYVGIDIGGTRCRIDETYGKDASQLNEHEWHEVMLKFERGLKEFIDKSQASLIIFGGGIALKQKARLQDLAQHLRDVTISLPKLGEDAGLFGALVLLQMQLKR